MIHQLYIRDYAVIEEVNISFGPGLNLLTGETGSGKSIIVDAIGIALGERADSDLVRTGKEKAFVEIAIEIQDQSNISTLLEDAGYSAEDGTIVISREISKAGKSQCRINGRLASVSVLKSITNHLVDAHGQHEHQFLLKPENHLPVLDLWCGSDVSALKDEVKILHSKYSDLQNKLYNLKTDERDRIRQIDLYNFQIEEIDNAMLTPGEDDDLQSDRNRLMNAEKLYEASLTAFNLISDRNSDISTLDTLNDALIKCEDVSDIDASLKPIVENLQSASYLIEEAARELRTYKDTVEFNPERLKEVDDRLELIRTLKRKYGDSIEKIVEYRAEISETLENLINNEQFTIELEENIKNTFNALTVKADELTKLRKKGAVHFAEKIEQELSILSMPNAKFEISFSPQDIDSTGADNVEFMFSSNPGEEAKPMAKIASGGEISRVMLAIKSAMSDADQIPTLIFDEIDVGVGGRTAEVIADKLQKLSDSAQVLCITHLPQVACRNGHHFAIEKNLVNNRTSVTVRQLNNEERVQEISRMLGGTNPTETAIRHAKEMLGYI